MNQDFGKRGNSLDVALLEIGGIQQPERTDPVTEPTHLACAFTWPPSVPPWLPPNLCRQLLGAMPKNKATPGPGNCSQLTGLTLLLPWIKSLYDLSCPASSSHNNVLFWQWEPLPCVCSLFISRTSESFLILVLPLLHAIYLEYVYRFLVEGRVEGQQRKFQGSKQAVFKDNQKGASK